MPDTMPTASEHAAHLKERIYVTFTALAVLLTLRAHEHVETGEAITALAVPIAGTLAAVFVADIVSHLVAHERLPTGRELRQMLTVTLGALSGIALPFVFLGFAAAHVWPVERAIRASTWALVAALVVIGYLAVRRVRLPFWQSALVLTAEAALGILVIALELLAHG